MTARLRRPIPFLALSLLLPSAVAVNAQEGRVRAEEAESTSEGYLEARWTRTDLARLAGALRAWRREHGTWPARCPDEAAASLAPPPSRDGWGQPYTCALDGEPRVVSSGPDGTLGSADDLVRALADERPDVAAEPAASPSGGGAGGGRAPATATRRAPVSDEALRTVDAMRRIAGALAGFAAAHGHYPVAERFDQLGRWVVPDHAVEADWSATDGWGNAWRYRTTDVGNSYSLASAGSDGRWELVAPLQPGPVPDTSSDLVVLDGRLVRWPAGSAGFQVTEGAGRLVAAEAKAEPKEPSDPMEATVARLERLARIVEGERRRLGAYPESDDAPRLFREIGAPLAPVDAWGRELDYLSLGSGLASVLVSAGPDGRLARSIEDYAHGAAAAGDDIVFRNGARGAEKGSTPSPGD